MMLLLCKHSRTKMPKLLLQTVVIVEILSVATAEVTHDHLPACITTAEIADYHTLSCSDMRERERENTHKVTG